MRNYKTRIISLALAAMLVAWTLPGAHAASQKVSFNFVNVDITAVAKFVSDVTGKNFIYDNRVKGKVTVIAPTKISVNDAYDLFTSVLQLKGYAIVPTGIRAYKIVPVAEARQSGLKVSQKRIPRNEDFIARLIPIEHISADSALRFLQPVISRNGYISSFGPGNLILIMDSGLVIEKVLSIVKAIDKPFEAEEPEVVYLESSDAEEMSRVLNDGIQKNAQARGTKPSARAVPVKRINALVLFGSRAERASMHKLLEHLDVEPQSEQGVIKVYFLENADADELSQVLKNLLGGSAKGRKPKGSAIFQSLSDISITPDKGTNALVIMASPSDYSSLEGIIKQLDRKRRQVFVEALIVEASVDKLLEMGSNWRAVSTINGEPVTVGGFGTMDDSSMSSIVSGIPGLSFGGAANYLNFEYPDASNPGQMTSLDVPGYAALFSLSEYNGVIKVLSSPQILTADNSEAKIHVGENVPFITKRETTTGGTTSQSIERKDVGITLKITPQITEGNNVRLEIYQEISSVKESTEKIYTEVGPTTTKRSTQTTVIVSDGKTVVISGLIQERDEISELRVPLLHRLPLIGWLFKYKTTKKIKNNLLIFLTPHIIRNSEDLDKVTKRKRYTFARREDMTVEGQMVVNFHPGVSENLAIAILSEKDLTLLERTKDDGYLVLVPEKMTKKKAFKLFKKVEEVKSVEPVYRMKTLD